MVVVEKLSRKTKMKNTMFRIKSLLFLFSLFILGSKGQSQSCFIQLDNATGQSFTSDELAQLDTAACALREVFPTAFQNDFAVYDFGFYLHQQGYEGGMPQVFQDKIAEVEQESPYFLLFGRELGSFPSGGRFWVELVVPKSNSYPCVTIDRVENIKSSLEIQLQGANGDWVARLTAGMSHVSQHIDKVYNCCTTGNQLLAPSNTCSVSQDYIEDVLRADGYHHYGDLEISISNKSYQNIPFDKEVVIHLDERCGAYLVDGISTFNLTDELETFVNELSGYNISSDVQIFYYNDITAIDFLVDHFENGSDPPAFSNNDAYRERIYVLDFEGAGPKVYYFIDFDDGTNQGFRTSAISSWWKSAIKWFFKRASTNPTTVVVGITAEYSVEACLEYWFNSELHESWFDALYVVIKRRGWTGFFVTVGENVINSPAAIFVGEIAKYCIDTPYENWNASDALINSTLAVILEGLVSPEMRDVYPLAIKIAKDITSKPSLLVTFVSDPKLVKAWEGLYSKPAWRTNTGYLTKVSRYKDAGLEIVDEGGELVVKQADGVRVGKLDPNDPYYPGEMKVRGKSSDRWFDPDDAGGSIVKKSWANPSFNQSGIDDISTHLSRFDDGAEISANNAYMIDRLNQIKNGQIQPTDFDKRFYTHELEEFNRFQNKGIANGVNDEDFYQNAHTASLESYSINEAVEKIYPPTVPHPEYAGY